MLRRMVVSLLIAGVLLAGCGGQDSGNVPATSAPEAPKDNPPGGSGGGSGEPTPVSTSTDVPAPTATEIHAPAVGRYSVTHEVGTTQCPTGYVDIPALPPEFMDLSLSEDAHTMTLYTNAGQIELFYTEAISPTGEVETGWEGVVTAGELDITYTVWYDLFGEGEISGLIHNIENLCETNRGFTAVRVGP